MEKKTILLAATTALVLAGCSDDLTENAVISPSTSEKPAAIMFGNAANPTTRAGVTGASAATLLGNKLYIYGAKTTGTGSKATTKAIFDNYVLDYEGNAGSTETNVKGWEYASKTSRKGVAQDVKYWDYTADKYDFLAVTASSLGANDLIKDVEGTIETTTTSGGTTSTTTSNLKLNVPDPSSVDNIYVADRVTATPEEKAAEEGVSPATVAYNNTVTFQFRRLGARMRIGFYETVPGYAIKNLVFYYVGAASGSKTLGVGGAFPQSGKYTVTYDDITNAASVKFNGGSNTMGWSSSFGTLDYTSAVAKAKLAGATTTYIDEDGGLSAKPVTKFLATSAATPTFAKGSYTIDGVANTESYYKPILPNENNTLKMQLRVDYTLVALDGSGDEINVRDAYVSVPVEFCKWKPNYAYTYLFKISDKSNGYTGKGGGGDQADPSEGDGRKPNPETGGDNNPKDYGTDSEVPPYVPDPTNPDAYIPDPDDPTKTIPNPDVPLVPNPEYEGNPGYTGGSTTGPAPKGDQGDPSNPVPTPTVPTGDPDNPTKPDPTNPAGLFPITFDAVVVDEQEYTQETVTTVATPSITTTAAGSDVTNNNEYKVGENITLTVQDGVTPTAWAYYYSSNEVTEKQVATMDAAGKCTWESLGTAAKATLTPNATNGAGYYVVRVTTSTSAVGYKVIKVVAQ